MSSPKLAYPNGPIYPGSEPRDHTSALDLSIYTAELTQRFMLGTRYVTWDGRVYKYARSAAICNTDHGVQNVTAPFILDDGATTVHHANKIGDISIDIETQTVAKDALAGGYVIIYSAVTQFRGIVANDTGVGTTIRVTLDAPLTVATVLDTTTICAYYSPYYGLSTTNDARSSTMGVPATYVSAASMFFWVQTWGPCRCGPGAAGYGNADGERQMVFGSNGALFAHTAAAATTLQYQHAGFIIPKTAADDAPLLMLQISM